jgi:hypothetical protein
MVFVMGRVFVYTIDRADFHTLRRVVMAYAFGAECRVYDIDVFALRNGTVWTFRFADITVDTFIINNKGHGFS